MVWGQVFPACCLILPAALPQPRQPHLATERSFPERQAIGRKHGLLSGFLWPWLPCTPGHCCFCSGRTGFVNKEGPSGTSLVAGGVGRLRSGPIWSEIPVLILEGLEMSNRGGNVFTRHGLGKANNVRVVCIPCQVGVILSSKVHLRMKRAGSVNPWCCVWAHQPSTFSLCFSYV